jgi:hypothetical protein
MQSVRGNTKQDSRKTLYEFLQENNFYIDHATADLLEKIITTSNRKANNVKGPCRGGKNATDVFNISLFKMRNTSIINVRMGRMKIVCFTGIFRLSM